MKKIDLHIHSSHSDGEESLDGIFELVREAGLHMFSVADHNYISPGSAALGRRAEESGAVFVQGVEVSCVDRVTGESLHLLGYSQYFDIGKLNRSLRPVVDGYNTRAKRIIAKLNDKYPEIGLAFDALIAARGSSYVSRNVLADELRKYGRGELMTMRDALREAYVEESDDWLPDVTEATDIIISAGGVPVLAHPGRLDERVADLDGFMRRISDAGVRGIEAVCPKHDKNRTHYWFGVADRYGLFVTAGSDWHGPNYSAGREIGYAAHDDTYEAIVSALSRPAA